MLRLNELDRLKKKRKRVGRGGSRGGTSGKGHKGQKARTGSGPEIKPFFEGGQMPLSRRIPRRGFTNIFKKEIITFNLRDLEAKFESGEQVTRDTLREKGLLKGKKEAALIKILGNGELTKKLVVKANAFSKTALQAIEKAKGKAELMQEISGGSVTS